MGSSRSARCCRSPRRPTSGTARGRPTRRAGRARAQRDDELRDDDPARLGRALPGLRPAEGVEATAARGRPRRALHGASPDAGDGPAGRRPRPRLGHDDARRRPPSMRPRGLWSSGTSRRRGRISSGSPTSPTWRPGAASSMWRSSSMCLRGGSSAGASRRRCARTSCSTRSSRRSTTGAARRLTGLVHHSDRGTQYLSMRYTDRLAEAGIAPSVGSRGDSYDNALAESVIGLFKTEVIQRRGPWRHLEAVEFATLAGSTGSTRGGCSNRSATCRRRSTKRATMSRPRWPDSHNSLSEIPGTVQGVLQSTSPTQSTGVELHFLLLHGRHDKKRRRASVRNKPIRFTDRVSSTADRVQACRWPASGSSGTRGDLVSSAYGRATLGGVRRSRRENINVLPPGRCARLSGFVPPPALLTVARNRPLVWWFWRRLFARQLAAGPAPARPHPQCLHNRGRPEGIGEDAGALGERRVVAFPAST